MRAFTLSFGNASAHKTTSSPLHSGKQYQVEIEFFWDGKPDKNIRVMGAIDDGGLRAMMPLTESFILSPDGTFVGEDAG